MSDIVTAYLETWNAEDETVRSGLLRRHWAPSATYTDPLAEVAGYEALAATIAAVRARFRGSTFTPVGEPDAHHRQVRFQWGLGPVGGEPVVIGFDVVVTDEDGRIATVFGFLDKVPA